MNYQIKKSFEKDLKKINDKKLLKQIQEIIKSIDTAQVLDEIANLTKLRGNKTSYRIRISDYRVGLEYTNETLFLVRFLHRKDIYKYFP